MTEAPRTSEAGISITPPSVPAHRSTPTLPETAAEPAARTLTRSDIMALGNKGKPWVFLPVAAKALAIAPGDTGLVFLTAVNLGSVGLRTLASEHVCMLSAEAQGHDDVVRLMGILDRLPSDRVTAAERIGAVAANLEALEVSNPEAGSRARSALGAWEAAVGGGRGTEYFRAIDGNVVERPVGSRGLLACPSLADQRGQARAFAASAAPAAELMGRPIVVEGVNPPWIFDEIMRATDRTFNGYRRRIVLVQSDVDELLDGLSRIDLRGHLADPRLDVYISDDCAGRLAEEFAKRLETVLVGQYIPVLATRRRASPPIEAVLGELERAQQAEHVELSRRIDGVYRGRDAAWWRGRFTSGAGLRVLIPTCRFSTFVRYSSEDLAEAFRSAGHEARVIMEPDERSCLSGIGYLRAVAELEPDLIVLINYPRAAMGQVIPANIPYVCWVQDAMPHLFEAKLGAAQGPLDFLAGVRMGELVSRFGYPRERCMPMPVVVSERKFSVVRRAAREQGVRIAFASHHGETPEAMHERLVRDAGKDPVLPRAMEALRPLAMRLGVDILSLNQKKQIRAGIVEAIRMAAGVEAPERVISVLTHAYVIPVADRVMRHLAVAWAVGIAQRRGWSLKLHGKHWDSHPVYCAYAAEPLEHGEALRDSYATATVHMHASYHGPFHQRVFECVLAGGLPLCRLVWPSVSPLMSHAKARLRERLGERFTSSAERVDGTNGLFRVSEHPELREAAEVVSAAGLDGQAAWGMDDLCPISLGMPAIADIEADAAPLVGPLLDVSFRDEGELERLIERASDDAAWREERVDLISGLVRGTFTHARLAQRLVGFVGDRLVGG